MSAARFAKVYSGKFQPQNPQKYKGNVHNIIFRSSYEIRFMKWCDLTKSVLSWGSEEIIVPYRSPVDGNIHRYFIDFCITIQDKHGIVKKYLIEVKPLKYTLPPKIPKRKTTLYLSEVKDYIVNQAKWKSATTFAKNNNYEFLIITEADLGLT